LPDRYDHAVARIRARAFGLELLHRKQRLEHVLVLHLKAVVGGHETAADFRDHHVQCPFGDGRRADDVQRAVHGGHVVLQGGSHQFGQRGLHERSAIAVVKDTRLFQDKVHRDAILLRHGNDRRLDVIVDGGVDHGLLNAFQRILRRLAAAQHQHGRCCRSRCQSPGTVSHNVSSLFSCPGPRAYFPTRVSQTEPFRSISDSWLISDTARRMAACRARFAAAASLAPCPGSVKAVASNCSRVESR